MNIWCLFSVDNNYDQPQNNLVSWWDKKPTIEELARFMERKLDNDNDILFIVGLWKGETRSEDHTQYRLQLVPKGVKI